MFPIFVFISFLSAVEWVGPKEGERNIKIKLDDSRKKIHVTDRGGRKPLRMIDLRYSDRVFIRLSSDKMRSLLSVRAPGEIDLVRLGIKKVFMMRMQVRYRWL